MVRVHLSTLYSSSPSYFSTPNAIYSFRLLFTFPPSVQNVIYCFLPIEAKLILQHQSICNFLKDLPVSLGPMNNPWPSKQWALLQHYFILFYLLIIYSQQLQPSWQELSLQFLALSHLNLLRTLPILVHLILPNILSLSSFFK